MHIAAGLRDGAKQDSVVEVRVAISLQINMNIFLNKEGMLKNIVKKQIIFPAFHYDAYLCRDILIINIYLLLQWERICLLGRASCWRWPAARHQTWTRGWS